MLSWMANLGTTVVLALHELGHHRSRSLLTMLGILIGTGSVVSIVSVGAGLSEYFENQMVSQATADMVYVMPDVPFRVGQDMLAGARPFKARDLEAVRGSDYVQSAYGGSIEVDAVVKHGWRSANVMLIGAPAEFLPVNNMEIEYGRSFTAAEEHGAARVAIIGPRVVEELYSERERVLGSTLSIKNHKFVVVGVLESRSAVENGSEVNLGVQIPLQTGQKRIWRSSDMVWIFAKVHSREVLGNAKEDIAQRLRQSRRIRSGADDDFLITTPEEWANFASNFIRALIVVFGIVAAVALITGGIGVMNVMLVAVRERTREIGLRKALGATSELVAFQFLVEAIALTTTGAVLGLLVGWGLAYLLMRGADELWNVFWTPTVPRARIVLVLGSSVVIGLLTGVYPAWRASQLDPVRAMRYE